MIKCFFCDAQEISDGRIFAKTDNFYARWDDMPVSEGHCEIAPKQHIESYFELTGEYAEEMHGLAQRVELIIDEKYKPDGYTIGINEGRDAGRTQDHLHMHIIPRYHGDVPDPRGGVRNIIPGKGNYDEEARRIGRTEYLPQGPSK